MRWLGLHHLAPARFTRRACALCVAAVTAAWSCSNAGTQFNGVPSASSGATSGNGTGGMAASSASMSSSASSSASASSGSGGSPASCTKPSDCPEDQTCESGFCAPACQNCAGTCCKGVCVADLMSDLGNCGMCGNACKQPDQVVVSCKQGMCSFDGCQPGFYNCDGMLANGCGATSPCVCTPGATQNCYPGDPATMDVGQCKHGSQKCNKEGTAWGLCEGFVLPVAEQCNQPNVDADCNGVKGDVPDIDGDGWTACDGDCCETLADCSKPKLVNPGAFEVIGNNIDDNCDGQIDEVSPACSSVQKFAGVQAKDLAQAMDLCQFTTANPPLSQRIWGVVDASLRFADGTVPSAAQLANIQNYQIAVLTDYGTGGVVPQSMATLSGGGQLASKTMAGLSNGIMNDEDDPNFFNPNPGTDWGNATSPPAVYLNAHGGVLPSQNSCNGKCPSGSGAHDSVDLRLAIRVPTNALSFSYQFRYFTAEYWTYQCNNYNDFFLALLSTKAPAFNQPDHNISFDANNNPVSVNNGFFQDCQIEGCYSCKSGTGPLQGTGMEVLTSPEAAVNGGKNVMGDTGGGTDWLETKAPVFPGETMTLELMVFDVSDGLLDSNVLLDAFSWIVTSSSVGTGPPG